ncbi:MAG: GntR family transcriptional regulator, partial [Myxococcota bacterium]
MVASNSGRPVTQGVFEALLSGIIEGDYVPGARLPAERDLAQQLGASRSALREAVRRLTAWRLVEPRRGSGVVVRDRNEWAMEVVPAYIRAEVMSGKVERIGALLPLVVSM